MSYKKLQFLLGILIFTASSVLAGNIKGKIYESGTNEGLPSATIVIEGTNQGYISDVRGEFTITNIAAGEHRLIFSYIGFEQKVVTVNVLEEGVTTIEVNLVPLSILGEEVVVTAQAAGQQAAINQQVNSNSITNVVSAQRIQEIPETSAAEAVGRLPGVSLSGGSIVVRGLSPHYNKIQIDGIDMASTSLNDRSSSLGMISQYMLEGIEMTKSAMADQDADVLGARVNLIIKEAPKKPTLEVVFQSGYNTLSKSLKNQKLSVAGSRRFLSDKLGIFGQINYENSTWATNALNASYERQTQGMELYDMSLKDVEGRLKGRRGASLVMDYKTGLTKLKMSNFYSTSETETTSRGIGYSIDRNNETRSVELDNSKLMVMTNSLRVEQVLGKYEIDAGISHSYSKNETPGRIVFNATDDGAIPDTLRWNKHPLDIPQYSNFNINEAFMQNASYNYLLSTERKYAVDLNFKTKFELGSWGNLEIKTGAKYKYLSKERDDEYYGASMQNASFQRTRDVANQYIDWFPQASEAGSTEGGLIGLRHFTDPDYYKSDFLLSDVVMDQMIDVDKVREFHEFMLENPMGFESGEGKPYNKNWGQSFNNDYYGNENFIAAYLMPTLVAGRNNNLTLIPGIRYEKNETSYTGYRIPYVSSDGQFGQHPEFADLNVTRTRKNEYFLPMLHLIYRPTKWLKLNSSYTHTLSRPKYRDIVPSWNVGQSVIQWNNPYLTPSLSKNIDLQFMLHGSKLGLLSVGAFKKNIESLTFTHGETTIIREDLDSNLYDGLQYNNEYLLMDAAGFGINYEMNNPEETYVSGLEFEYQSNFYFLPGILKGLVFNANYTLFDSEAKYPMVIRELDMQTFKYTYRDSAYTDRLIDQATNILNIMIGFDYKGFSIRGSMKYTDDIFSYNDEAYDYRRSTSARVNYDVSIKQSWKDKGLAVFCNITNIGRSKFEVINYGTGYPTNLSYGGLGIQLGLRYKLMNE